MNLLIVAATPFEIAPLTTYLDKHFIRTEQYRYQKGEIQVTVLITGVGLTLTAFALGNALGADDWQLAINAGIAGAISRELEMGDVVQVISERFADLGVEEKDGSFTDVHEMGLIEANQAPFVAGKLKNAGSEAFNFLKKVHGISVNKVHGSTNSIDQIGKKYPDAEIETMEGAAFFYACLSKGIPFLEIRSISNYVEARNRENWNLPLAIERLNDTLIQMIKVFFI